MSDTQSVTPSSLNNNKDGIKSKDESDCYIIDLQMGAFTNVEVMIVGASDECEANDIFYKTFMASTEKRIDSELWSEVHDIANQKRASFEFINYEGEEPRPEEVKKFYRYYPGLATDIIKNKVIPVINAKTGEVTCAKR